MLYQLNLLDLLPDGDDPSIYLKAVAEDVANVDGISDVRFCRGGISFNSDLSTNEIKTKIKLFLIRDQDYVQYVSLERA